MKTLKKTLGYTFGFPFMFLGAILIAFGDKIMDFFGAGGGDVGDLGSSLDGTQKPYPNEFFLKKKGKRRIGV
jgi:hypothetical protein